MQRTYGPFWSLALLAILLCADVRAAGPGNASQISWLRTPGGGIQPQIVVDADGVAHLVYFKGDPAAGDLWYARRMPGEPNFSSPLRVNSHPGSAVALGTIRGGQLAVGKAGRVHVVWNGSKLAQPRSGSSDPKHDTPMLYTRLDDTASAFEPQRNLIHDAHGLDGGGSIAADSEGNVYVTWHANPAADGEGNRRVYLATSRDEGQSFAREVPISAPGTGVCGCCGMKAIAGRGGRLLVLYRSATDLVGRNMYLLRSDDSGRTFHSQIVDRWEVARCPMSSAALVEAPADTAASDLLAGWETADHVYFGWVRGTGSVLPKIAPGGVDAGHPAAAINSRGEAIFVWTEGTGWNRGGSVAWQVYDAQGNPTAEQGSRNGVPTWSFAAVFANPEGGFTIVY